MRLLHTRKLRFEDFFDASIPAYAILSHRWVDEISYQEFLYLNRQEWAGGHVFVPLIIADDSRRRSSGFRKVMKFREIAAADGYDWVWADTVCIDKTSSAELSEAINSMFRWYSRSEVCYVYLSDVLLKQAFNPGPNSFEKSEWFMRGWTLQELIAPVKADFRDAAWEVLGDKRNLQDRLSCITSIPGDVLRSPSEVFNLSCAEIMSLATGRKTSRTEDRAYSLFGLFKVGMPLLYGEGEEAFRRLQHSILQKSPDQSILAHRGKSLLAKSADDFAFHQKINAHPAKFDWKAQRHRGIALLEDRRSQNIPIALHYEGGRTFAGYLEDTSFEGRLIVLEYRSLYSGLLRSILHLKDSKSYNGRSGWSKISILEDGRCGCYEMASKKDGRKPCEQLAQRYLDHASKREFKSKFSPGNMLPWRIKLKYEMMYIE